MKAVCGSIEPRRLPGASWFMHGLYSGRSATFFHQVRMSLKEYAQLRWCYSEAASFFVDQRTLKVLPVVTEQAGA